MPKVRIVAYCALCSLLPFSTLNTRVASKLLATSEEQIRQWVNQTYKSVLDRVLPIAMFPGETFPKNVQWVFEVRIHGREAPESLYFIEKTYENRVTVNVKTVDSPISAQMMNARRKQPNLKAQDVDAAVMVREQRVDNMACVRLNEVAKELEKLRISPILPDELRMDPTTYEVYSRSQWGNEIHISYNGIGARESSQSYLLFEWIERTRKILHDECGL